MAWDAVPEPMVEYIDPDFQKYQDDMQGNPTTGVKCKTQKTVKSQVEKDKFSKAVLTENRGHERGQQWQEQAKSSITVFDMARRIRVTTT